MINYADEVTTMKVNELKDSLIGVDRLSKKGNVYTARRGYFYGRCESGESFARNIQQQLPEAKIIDYGNHYADFKGGAPVNQQSHYWVKFSLAL